jgi:acetylornithine deacetylase
MIPAEKLLRELIALPSVNPAFLPAGDTHAGEQRVADFLAATAARAGLDIEFQKVSASRSNLLATLTPSGKVQQRILLAPHMDTVGVFSEDQFLPTKKGDGLYGRGACDTKGSVAAMLSALAVVAKRKQRPRETEIVFAGLVDEENAQTGSRALANSGLRANLAIVGEPTRLQIVTSHKGSLWLRFETHGKAAHGARPELGKNAVHEMARIVDLLQTDYATQIRRRKHRLLGRATVSVGSISGGRQPNIVPATCSASVDRRTLPGETENSVRAEIQALLRRKKLQAEISSDKTVPCLPLETNYQLPLVQKFFQVTRQKRPVGVDYFCDAAVLAHGGIPSIVFGPGDIAQAHSSDEWISVRSLQKATDILVQFLQSLP